MVAAGFLHRRDSETGPAKPGHLGLSDFAQVKINDRSNFAEFFHSQTLTEQILPCSAASSHPLNCRILGLYNCDTERREASPIPEMETGTCRVAHFPLPDTREFRLRAVRSAVASRESMLGRARAGCSERLGRRCENTLPVIRPPFTKLS